MIPAWWGLLLYIAGCITGVGVLIAGVWVVTEYGKVSDQATGEGRYDSYES